LEGLEREQQTVAHFIARRDRPPSNARRIFMTQGASVALQMILEQLAASLCSAFLMPVPQYPLYFATITLLGAEIIGYEQDEAPDWAVSEDDMERKVQAARIDGLDVRSFVIINPVYPSGSVLEQKNKEDIVRLCYREGLALPADEVHQESICFPRRGHL
jgi:aspartate/methionine/tyrosine aminotransferase